MSANFGPRIKVVATLRGLNGTTKKLDPQELARRARDGMQAVLDDLTKSVEEKTPVGVTGDAQGSIYNEVYGTDLTDLYGVVASSSEYFRYIDEGRDPGSTMPPKEPLQEWGEAHGFVTDSAVFLLRRAIARRGIPALNIVRRAVEERKGKTPIVFMKAFVERWWDDAESD